MSKKRDLRLMEWVASFSEHIAKYGLLSPEKLLSAFEDSERNLLRHPKHTAGCNHFRGRA